MTIKFGTTDSDIFLGENGRDLLEGNSGDDILQGGNHNDSLEGDSGDDLLQGGNHDDLLDGGSGDDLLYGGHHNDILRGDSGDDLLRGGHHNDLLDGGSGNDSLEGSVGQDTLIGGDGADKFIFTSIDSVDVITDFDSDAGDKIVFDADTGVTEIEQLTVHVGVSYNHTSESERVTSLYVDGERFMEFDRVVSLQVEDFEFI